jgi:hypothetical protein
MSSAEYENMHLLDSLSIAFFWYTIVYRETLKTSQKQKEKKDLENMKWF